MSKDKEGYRVDIGISRTEVTVNETSYYSVGEVSDIGDLNGWYGFQELDASQLTVQPGKVYPEEFATNEELTKEVVTDLIRMGYLFVRVKKNYKESFLALPINVVEQYFNPDKQPLFEGKANFLLTPANGEIAYAVINGFLWKLEEPIVEHANGLIID
jgi:hypothetical protein